MSEEFNGVYDPHNQARRWIAEKRGTYITQSELKNLAPQLNVEFLLTSAKGIYKPAGSKYAFSIRHEPTGGYLDRKPDELQEIWSIAYDAEIDSRHGRQSASTTSGLLNCLADRLPVAIFWRHQALQPYEILGLGRVTDYSEGQFQIFGPVDGTETVEAEASEISAVVAATDAPASGFRRLEQQMLRAKLLKGSTIGQCRICQTLLPAELLVAAHIKQRRLCTTEERLNPHIATLMCKLGCDPLFEAGFLRVMDSGKVYRMVGEGTSLEPLKSRLQMFEGKTIEFLSPTERSFFAFHRESFVGR
jgi:hypothetical protein